MIYLSSLFEDRTYSYGCAMIFFDFPEIKEIHKLIDEQDVYIDEEDDTFGLETESHVTLLYGFHKDVKPSDVLAIAKDIDYDDITLFNVSLFENDKYDVLKFDAKCDGFNKANKALSKFPHTNSYPDYHPHSTIAYLKPGTGKKYVDMFDGKEYKVLPNKLVYSKSTGGVVDIKI